MKSNDDIWSILHMSQELSCHDMCKFITRLDHNSQNYSKKNF